MLSWIQRSSSAAAGSSGSRLARATVAFVDSRIQRQLPPTSSIGCPSPSWFHCGANSLSSTSATTTSQRRFYMAAAAADSDSINGIRRGPPPTLDSFDYDEGFGGYDYQPDIYDAEDMKSQDLWDYDDDGMLIPKAQPPALDANDNYANANANNEAEQQAPNEDTVERTTQVMETVSIQHEETEPAVAASFSSPTTLNNGEEGTGDNQKYVRDAAFFKKASYGFGVSSELDRMEDRLVQLKQDIGTETNDPKFNPNSPRQVSEALFGSAGESTSKEVLEGMAASGNKLADLMLQFRQLAREINKWKKRRDNKDKGTYVQNVNTVKRASSPAPQQVVETTEDSVSATTTAAVSSSSELEPAPRSQPQTRIEPDDPLLLLDASGYIYRA